MPRIPDAEISRIKQAVPLTRLCEARGVVLTGQGHNLLGRCPFHDDRTPSLVVEPEKNLWHCMGACQCGGSNVDFVMRDHGVGFRVAVEILSAMAGGAPYPARPAGVAAAGGLTHSSARRLANPLSVDADGDALLGQVAEFYHRTLSDNALATAAPALAYLRERKLADAETIRHFRLGYADRSLGLRIPDKARREGAQVRLRLTKLGLLRASGHELLSGAVVVPITDDAGNVVGMYGRMTATNLRAGTPYHRYLPGPHRAAWNAAGALAAAGDADGALIVCEAVLDALSFWRHGLRHVTAAYGVNGFTEHHRRLVAESAIKTVFLAYDNDDAGNTAAATLADELIALGKSVYRVVFPERVKDANGLAMASDDPAVALRGVLTAAQFMGGNPRVSVEASAPTVLTTSPINDVNTSATKEETSTPAVVSAPLPQRAISAEQPPTRPASAAQSAAVISSLAAAPTPPADTADTADAATDSRPPGHLIADGDDFRAVFGPRRYRIRSLLKNADLSALKIGLRLTVMNQPGDPFHQDTIDLCHAKQRAAFIAAATDATKADADAIRADLGKLLDWSEAAWTTHRRAMAAADKPTRPPIDADAAAAALVFVRAPNLLERIAADYDACGLVGDAAPKLVSYLCAVSRKLSQPLAVLTMAPSAAGKSTLQDGTLAFVPEEDRMCVSALTGQALHYLESDLAHRVLAIAEESGASRASYSLKLLQSEGKISLAVPIKDADSGQITTQVKEVRGPVALFLTTTASQIDEELANRCIVLTVDDSPEQTARVHVAQRERETLDGLLHRSRADAIRTLHQNAQRLLEPIAIVNPFARALTFRFDRARTRRDHQKYLGLIRAITFLHQHQRPRRDAVVDGRTLTYIEVTLADIAAANRLAAAVLGRSLDELAPQTRALLNQLDAWISAQARECARPRESIRFTRRMVREATGASPNQVRDHLTRLVDLDYVASVRGNGQGQRQEFVLLYDGEGANGDRFLLGLADLATIQTRMQAAEPAGTACTLSPQTPNFVPRLSPVCPPFVRGVWSDENDANDGQSPSFGEGEQETGKNDGQGGIRNLPSHRSHEIVLADDPVLNGHRVNGHAVLSGAP